MTPETFQTTAMAWLAAGTVVVGGLTIFVMLVIAKVKEIEAALAARKSASEENSDRLDQHAAAIKSLAPTANLIPEYKLVSPLSSQRTSAPTKP